MAEKKKPKVEPIPKEVLEAASLRFRTKTANMLEKAYWDRARDWGMTKFEVARKSEKPLALIERMMMPEGLKGLGIIGMIAAACDCELDFKFVDVQPQKGNE